MSEIGRDYTLNKTDEELIGHIGFGEKVVVDKSAHRKVLLVGTDSYIGNSFEKYANYNYKDNFRIDVVDTLTEGWKDISFSIYDCVYHLAGIAHSDTGSVSDSIKEKYYKVNTDLAMEVAKKAKADGAKRFIFMSSMIVYGEAAPFGKSKIIDENTVPAPANFYGDSKLQADVGIRGLADDRFKVIILRPPMIYGKGCKGNYAILSRMAKKLPIFPNVDNARSMLYIENLCEFLCQIMLIREIRENAVVLVPQNSEWVNTSQMVKCIAEATGGKIRLTRILTPAVFMGSKLPGKGGTLINKAFGNFAYDMQMSGYIEKYRICTLLDSIRLTEEE